MTGLWCPEGVTCCEATQTWACNNVDGSNPCGGLTCEQGSTSCFCPGNGCSAGFLCAPGGICVDEDDTSSCPFIYAWNGDEFVLQNEAIPFSFFASLEDTSHGALPALVDSDGTLRVRVTEERDEISYIDTFSLRSVTHDNPDARVLPDVHGVPHTVGQLEAPASCMTSEGEDCLTELHEKDEEILEIDPVSVQARSPDDLSHWITLGFTKPTDAGKSAKLLLNVETADIMDDVAYEHSISFGQKGMEFFDALLSLLRIGHLLDRNLDIGKLYLHVEVWNGDEWIKQGVIKPGNYRHWDDFVLPIDLTGIQGNEVRVRLHSVGWYLYNAAGIDWTPDSPMIVERIPLSHAVANDGRDARSPLLAEDGKRHVMHKGDHVDLSFAAPEPPEQGMKTEYIFSLRGYYIVDVPKRNEAHGTNTLRSIRHLLLPGGINAGFLQYLRHIAGEL